MKNILLIFICLSTLLSLQASDFVEVNPESKHPLFRQRMKRALKYLKEGDHAVALRTYEFIAKGKAKIDLITDLTYNDYLQVLEDFKREGKEVGFKADDYERLTIDPVIAKKFEDLMDGYMWDDRIYVSSNLKPYDLAVTLIHEVNHVINKSHTVYYHSDLHAFIEEYRAFYVEALFTNNAPQDKEEFRALKEYVAELYEFPLSLIEKLPDVPPGKLLPY